MKAFWKQLFCPHRWINDGIGTDRHGVWKDHQFCELCGKQRLSRVT